MEEQKETLQENTQPVIQETPIQQNEPPKKKKTSLVIAGIVAIILIIGLVYMMSSGASSGDPIVGKWDLTAVNYLSNNTGGYVQFKNNKDFSLCLESDDTPFSGTWEYVEDYKNQRVYYAYIGGIKMGLFTLDEDTSGKQMCTLLGTGKLEGYTLIFMK